MEASLTFTICYRSLLVISLDSTIMRWFSSLKLREGQLGHEILVRHACGIVLTEECEFLFQYARRFNLEYQEPDLGLETGSLLLF